ncbi:MULTISPECIES: GLPGLI family protein [Chryseobacterium]|uniref:GLPGLI family protein n=2 Tax=Chryseobacterium TaxID=59732 RepID=A0ABY2R4Y9_9FLAO|nr:MULTISPECIES: GLPGLI family protein [Chryseobacterium]THV57896.1 GLPGLI family protein [Chryseobacterium candidae]SIR08676.1 GLPGLI family protein [Chryseobacterium sp. RU33C]
MKSLLFILLGTVMFFSQNNRFIYEVKYKKDSTSKDITRENYYLDITKEDIAYYNRLNYISDSVFTATGRTPINRLTSFLLKKKDDNIYQNYEYIGDVNFYKISEEARQQWTITDSIKIADNLSLQKATTEFGGRNWIAWFTKDIPMPYGPYKFSGLPGLIMELYDTKKNYYFNVIKSEKIPDDYQRNSLNNYIPRAIPVTQKDLNKLRLDLYSNPFKYVLNGNLTMREGQKLQLDDGTILSKEQLKPAEANERKKLKAFNNPIELDKAVKYP